MVKTTRSRGLLTVASALAFLFAGAACNAILGITAANQEAADSGAAEAGPVSLSCENYCNAVTTNCPNEEYTTPAVCLTLCNSRVIDYGELTDTTNDSIGCRQNYAMRAKDNPAYCRAAGPLGGGVCGDPCESFCLLDTAECVGDNAQFDGGEPGCASICKAEYPYLTDAGNDLAVSMGDNVNCRIWHLEAALDVEDGGPDAAAALLGFHCPHTGLATAPKNIFCHN